MHPTTPAIEKATQRAALPRLLVVGVLLLALLMAGWVVYTNLYPTRVEALETQPDPAMRGRFGAPVREPPRDGVRAMPGGVVVARLEGSRLELRREAGRVDVTFAPAEPLIPPEARSALRRRQQLIARPQRAAELNVTAEQIEKLRAIPNTPSPISEADEARAATLLAAIEAAAPGTADRTTAEAALLDMLRELTSRDLGATRQSYADRAEQVRQILTPEQLGP